MQPVQPKLRIIVVAEQTQQRLAFSDTIQSWGYELLACVTSNQLTPEHFKQDADVWLVDSEQDYAIIQEIDSKANPTTDRESTSLNQTTTSANLYINTDNGKTSGSTRLRSLPKAVVLVGFLTAPYLNESQPYAKWQRQLKRKLADSLGKPELLEAMNTPRPEMRNWQYVVLLGASMGGPLAVKEFLDNLPSELPVAILLAQHFNEGMLNSLPRILNRHNTWRCDVIYSTQPLITGRCLIAPVQQSIVCDSTGRVIFQSHGWASGYQPCISQLLSNCSEVFGNNLVHIIFSGMGDDGSDMAEKAKQNGSQIWAQRPDSSTCESQPQSMIDTGFVDLIDTPKGLAEALVKLCKRSGAKVTSTLS